MVETANHFKCIDMIIDSANYALSEAFIKQLHAVLKSGTSEFPITNRQKIRGYVPLSPLQTERELHPVCFQKVLIPKNDIRVPIRGDAPVGQ